MQAASKRLRRNIRKYKAQQEKMKVLKVSQDILKQKIIQDMERLGTTEAVNKKEKTKVLLIKPKKTNFNFDYFHKLANENLTPAQTKKLIDTTVSYKMNEDYLIELIQKGNLELSDVRKGVHEFEMKSHIRLGEYKEAEVGEEESI